MFLLVLEKVVGNMEVQICLDKFELPNHKLNFPSCGQTCEKNWEYYGLTVSILETPIVIK